jgi:hypothetical protein
MLTWCDNNKVSTVNGETREDDPQYGDKWTSTKVDNNSTEKKEEIFNSEEGPNKKFDQPVELSNTDLTEIGDEILLATDSESILKSLTMIKNKQDYSKLKGYMAMNGTNLDDLLKENLSEEEFKKSQDLISKYSNKIENITEKLKPSLTEDEISEVCKNIKISSSGIGADEKQIQASLQTLTNKADFLKVNQYYKDNYGMSIKDQLKDELTKTEFTQIYSIITKLV